MIETNERELYRAVKELKVRKLEVTDENLTNIILELREKDKHTRKKKK